MDNDRTNIALASILMNVDYENFVREAIYGTSLSNEEFNIINEALARLMYLRGQRMGMCREDIAGLINTYVDKVISDEMKTPNLN